MTDGIRTHFESITGRKRKFHSLKDTEGKLRLVSNDKHVAMTKMLLLLKTELLYTRKGHDVKYGCLHIDFAVRRQLLGVNLRGYATSMFTRCDHRVLTSVCVRV